MWIWYLLLGSGSGSRTAESQKLPGNNFTAECNSPGNFMCGDGMCVPSDWQCNKVSNCVDGSDERGCPKVKSKCAPTFFACANGVHCIIGRFRCNGFSDCPDESDEENCTGNPLVCSETRFKCRNGRCVDRSFLCNGQNNCMDNSDEELCLTTAEAPGFVTLDHSLRYYPSITYGVIGSAIIFVLVVALLALVLHHQRKRSVLLPRSVRGSTHHHQPLLLSRLVILDRGHANARGLGLSPGSSNAAGQYTTTPQALHLLSGAMYPSTVSLDSPPSYSESVLDVSRPPWFDLPPPPYVKDSELSSEGNLPQYDNLQDGLSHRTSPDSAYPPPRMLAPDSQTGPSPTEESDQL